MKEFKDWYENSDVKFYSTNYGQYSVSKATWIAALKWVRKELKATAEAGCGNPGSTMWHRISDILEEEK